MIEGLCQLCYFVALSLLRSVEHIFHEVFLFYPQAQSWDRVSRIPSASIPVNRPTRDIR